MKCHKKPNQTKANHIYLIYMYKQDLALNNLQWLICHETQPNQTKPQYSNKTVQEILFGLQEPRQLDKVN